MARVVTYGRQPETAPPGTFREVHFPELALLDQGTSEGFVSRRLASDGFSVLDLPRTISMQYVDDMGHMRAVPAGALHEVFVDGENGKLSGKGWLADTDDGHLAEIVILSAALRHNSVDLRVGTPPKISIVEHGDFWDDDFWVEVVFDEAGLGKTTLVASPAFRNAHAELPDEVRAALGSDEPLVVSVPSTLSAHTPVEEIMAGATALPSWDYFHRPEADIPHKIIVGTPDDDGWIPVYGHLAQWNVPHRGYDGRTVYAPRPRDNYREFNQPGVLTDRGQVETGPITLYGGHISLADAANDPRHAWADVKLFNGKHGPWMCGVVRPHVAAEDADVYVARASRTSGHWKGSDLCMIVSCTSEGFNVPGLGWEPAVENELVAAYVPQAEGEVVAGFEVDERPRPAIPTELLSLDELTADAQQRVLEGATGGHALKTADSTESVLSDSTGAILKGRADVLDKIRHSRRGVTEDDEVFDGEQAHRDAVVAVFLEEEIDA